MLGTLKNEVPAQVGKADQSLVTSGAAEWLDTTE
jgi:hypothetical protein